MTDFFSMYCIDVPCLSKPNQLLVPESVVQNYLPSPCPLHPTPSSQIALLQGQNPLHMRTHSSLVICQSEQILCSLLNLVLLYFRSIVSSLAANIQGNAFQNAELSKIIIKYLRNQINIWYNEVILLHF